MRSLKLLSPAKINLFLRVLKKRPDGYHDIHTLFERISLCDEITLRPVRGGIRLRTHSRSIPRDSRNLAVRAARLLQTRCRVRRGVVITLRKRIPVGAGLGGGSSNAAAVLSGLNRLWRLGLSRQRLARLGLELGSDVPFFILKTPFAVGRGRGERLRPVRAARLKIWHCLVKPAFSISTREAYARVARRPSSLTPQKPNVRMLLRSLQTGRAHTLAKLLTNSLEHTLNKRVRVISGIKKKLLEKGALASLLSGSGSAVFGVFKTRKKAQEAARALRKKQPDWQIFVASTY